MTSAHSQQNVMKHRLKLLLATKCAKKQYFHDFPIQMYGAIGQNTLPCMYSGMLLKVFGLEIAHVASPYHPEALNKKSQIVLLQNIKCLF